MNLVRHYFLDRNPLISIKSNDCFIIIESFSKSFFTNFFSDTIKVEKIFKKYGLITFVSKTDNKGTIITKQK